MPNEKSDSSSVSRLSADEQRDLSAKGGPMTGSLGIPDDKHGIASPYNEDTQTQLAAKGKKRNKTSSNNPSNKKK